MIGRTRFWATDITYIPIQGGFIYLCAVIDWYSRAVLRGNCRTPWMPGSARRPLNGRWPSTVPEIFNTDQGSRFTSTEFTEPLLAFGVKISMDGKGRALDNVFVDRLWRTVK